MRDVVVDGVRYAPADDTARIGIAITTRDRPDILTRTLTEWRKHLPVNAALVVVDDASKTPVSEADYRFSENVGIARAKNKCLELLYAQGVEHIFLADDDIWPTTADWWPRYVESPEPHLMWVFDKPRGATKSQVEILYKDTDHVAYHATRGCLLYLHRSVLDRVGGFDPGFQKWGWEHVSFSDRIHAAGLTTWRYADVADSDELFYSMDRENEIHSTATDEAKRYSEGPGLELRMASRHSDTYIEFRELEDVVLTTLLTEQDDPQRGKPMSAESKMVSDLARSCQKHQVPLQILTTGIEGDIPHASTVPVTQHINPYFERWLQIYQHLRDHPEIGRVWCVDATDVTMNRNPFPEMQAQRLYFGYEPKTLRDRWMIDNHPDNTLQTFMKANPNLPLLNMGVVGGERDLVMSFAHAVVKFFFDDQIDWIMGWETGQVGVGDMATGNFIARTRFADQIDTGPHVVNVFKSTIGAEFPWWLHKAV